VTWRRAVVAPDRRCHLLDDVPLYDACFDEILAFHEPGLAAVRVGEAAWHIDERGRAAYAARFRRTFGFYEERAAVCGGDGWHHILPDGTDLYRGRYAWCGNFQEGRCPVRGEDGLYHHVDLDGRAAYPRRWRYAGDYRDGHAVVQRDDGLSTHIDVLGRPLHGLWFRDLDVFHKGVARARDERGWTHVDRAGLPIYAARFEMVEPFYNGHARAERFDGSLVVIDETGRPVVELRGAVAAAASQSDQDGPGSAGPTSPP